MSYYLFLYPTYFHSLYCVYSFILAELDVGRASPALYLVHELRLTLNLSLPVLTTNVIINSRKFSIPFPT